MEMSTCEEKREGGGAREGEAAKEREGKRGREGKNATRCLQTLTTRTREKRTEEGVKMIQFGFENRILLVFKSLPDAV